MANGLRRFRRTGGIPPHLGGRHARARRWAVVGVLVALCWNGTAAPTQGAERASASCQAQLLGDRVVATITLQGFVEEETLRLLRLGMRGRGRVDATVVRKHWGIFEQTAASRVVEFRLSATADKRDLLLDNRSRAPAVGPINLERLALRLVDRNPQAERLTLRVSVRLQVVTASSLAEAAAWATDSHDDETSSSLLTRGLLAAVANDLTRSAEASCPVLASRTESSPRR